MNNTRRLVITNMTLYKQFYNIYINLKDLIRPISVPRIMQLENSYKIFKYERTSTESRGLPHVDLFKGEYKHMQVEDEIDSTDRSLEVHL